MPVGLVSAAFLIHGLTPCTGFDPMCWAWDHMPSLTLPMRFDLVCQTNLSHKAMSSTQGALHRSKNEAIVEQ